MLLCFLPLGRRSLFRRAKASASVISIAGFGSDEVTARQYRWELKVNGRAVSFLITHHSAEGASRYVRENSQQHEPSRGFLSSLRLGCGVEETKIQKPSSKSSQTRIQLSSPSVQLSLLPLTGMECRECSTKSYKNRIRQKSIRHILSREVATPPFSSQNRIPATTAIYRASGNLHSLSAQQKSKKKQTRD
jgi:hypothetical protein